MCSDRDRQRQTEHNRRTDRGTGHDTTRQTAEHNRRTDRQTAEHKLLESQCYFRLFSPAVEKFVTVPFRKLVGNHVVSTPFETNTKVRCVRVWHVVRCVLFRVRGVQCGVRRMVLRAVGAVVCCLTGSGRSSCPQLERYFGA